MRDFPEQCRGQPAPAIDCGAWYDWLLELSDCGYERETLGNRSLIEAWFLLVIISRSGHATAPATLVLGDLGQSLVDINYGLHMVGSLLNILLTIVVFIIVGDKLVKYIDGSDTV